MNAGPEERRRFAVLDGGAAPTDEETEDGCWRLLPDGPAFDRERGFSQFAGLPYWPDAEPWPVCRGCGEPLSFLLQVRTDAAYRFFPGPLRLLTLFYCLQCRPWYDTHQERFRVALVPVSPELALLAPKLCPLPPRPITASRLRLLAAPDAPSAMSLANLTPLQRLAAYENETVEKGDKLGGYPAFLSHREEPACEWCGKPMRFILQLNDDPRRGVSFAEEPRHRLFLFGCLHGATDGEWALSVQNE